MAMFQSGFLFSCLFSGDNKSYLPMVVSHIYVGSMRAAVKFKAADLVENS